MVSTGPAGAELLGRGAGTVLDPPNDPTALAHHLRAYRDDPERRGREGRAARARALATFDRRGVVDTAVATLGNVA